MLEHLGQRWRDEEGTFAGALAEVDHHLATSCSQLWTHCLDMVTHMEEEALQMSPEMAAVHSRLADLQRRLQDLLQREHSSAEVQQLAGELQEIDAARVEQGGVFWGDVEAPAPGQAICNELLSYDMGQWLLLFCISAVHGLSSNQIIELCVQSWCGSAHAPPRMSPQS